MCGVCVYWHIYIMIFIWLCMMAARVFLLDALLQIWCWEHIAVTWPVHDRVQGDFQPFVYLYRGIVTQHLSWVSWSIGHGSLILWTLLFGGRMYSVSLG